MPIFDVRSTETMRQTSGITPDVEADPYLDVFYNAQSTGIAGAFLGHLVITAAGLFDVVQTSTQQDWISLAIGTIFLSVVGFAYVSVPIGLICAYVAYRLFRGSAISVGWMTLALVAIADLSILGWILVKIYSPLPMPL